MSEANSLPKPVHIDLNDRSYYIRFCSDAQAIVEEIKPFCSDAAIVITNPTIWRLHGASFNEALRTHKISAEIWEMGDGEKYKSVETASTAWDFMVERKFGRKTCVIAFGGGVVGDLAGFVAATYLRGVPFIQVPTTVVSMVDSSVGGKTGVDHPLGKNLIGAFYQPKLVAMNMDFLQTLDDHNYRGGLAEVIKYGVIYDASFFQWLEENLDLLLSKDPVTIARVVQRSCEIKAEVVSQDEHESGLRAILNYGHTFGHAIESLGEYQKTQYHGQAVAIGMCCAADLAVNLGLMPEADAVRIESLIARAGLPQHLSKDMDSRAIYERMHSDKKVEAGKVRFVLPTHIGHVELKADIPADAVLEVLTSRQR